ncbi:MAG: hypothetical protein WEC75_01235 [Dehalococcoidia bacterium]
MKRHGRHTLLLAQAAVMVAGLSIFAACGGDDDDDGDAAAAPSATVAAAEPTEAAEPTAPSIEEFTLQAVDGGDLGAILADSRGFTLYRFTNDTAGSGSSACEGACANTWPPLTLTGEPTADENVTGEVGTITRTDGSTQVTYNGMPLYFFVNDTAAGETNGQAVGDIWFVVTP